MLTFPLWLCDQKCEITIKVKTFFAHQLCFLIILSDNSVYTKYELENWDTLRSWLFIEKSIRDGRERHMCDKWSKTTDISTG